MADLQRPEPTPLQPLENDDIYRGDPLGPPPRSPSPISIASSSSSSSFFTTGRLGAIAAVVELAISRWARARSPSSSRSSSPSSSHSIATESRCHSVRRRERRSASGNFASEKEVSARIKAREESRRIARDFTLYLPPPLTSGTPSSSRIYQTSSLSSALDRLDSALKKSAKARRNQDRGRSHKASHRHEHPEEHHHHMLPIVKAPSRAASFVDLSTLRKQGKHKGKEVVAGLQPPIPTRKVPSSSNTTGDTHKTQKAWWLDVSSPTWEDMRAIGKLLHLHPLTLEDILHQDPREKLEIFPRLGYYLIVFRAIESRTTQERSRHQHDREGEHSEDEGVVGEANIYLVVFREGICSFHFTDISEHIDRVRNRVLLLEETINMSSDWIAHGLLDSVVDSFTPFLEEIEKEVLLVENLVFSDDHCVTPTCTDAFNSESDLTEINEIEKDNEKHISFVFNEKQSLPLETTSPIASRILFPLPNVTLLIQSLRHLYASTIISISSALHVHVAPSASTTGATLRRMARARKVVTSLTRLLATKSEVVTQIRKRLLTTSDSGLGNGAEKSDDVEVAIYMGDVHDHILTLQYSLAHYERMLSQSHPAYLSQLRNTVSRTKFGTDKALMMLTIVSIGVLCIQSLIGMFSMNIHIPANGLKPGYPYNAFGIILAASLIISGIFLCVVRRWWIRAKRKRITIL